MTPKRFWARLRTDADYPLRLGAWYNVKKLGPQEAVLDIVGERVGIPRSYLEIMSAPPNRWSVVSRLKHLERLPGVKAYGVCPNCRERVPLAGRPLVLRCTRCSEIFDVAWDEEYHDEES